MLKSINSISHKVVLFIAKTLYIVVLIGDTLNVIELPVPETGLPTLESSASNRSW